MMQTTHKGENMVKHVTVPPSTTPATSTEMERRVRRLQEWEKEARRIDEDIVQHKELVKALKANRAKLTARIADALVRIDQQELDLEA